MPTRVSRGQTPRQDGKPSTRVFFIVVTHLVSLRLGTAHSPPCWREDRRLAWHHTLPSGFTVMADGALPFNAEEQNTLRCRSGYSTRV